MSANMFSQRALQLSMRRLATTRSSMMSKALRMSAPAAIATGQIRQAATSSAPTSTTTAISHQQAYDLLAEQRRHRPVSPHLTIYKPQIPWILSSLNRITGVMLSGTFYLFGIGYLVAPALGWHLETASIAAAVAAWPIALKLFAKFIYAMPFAFHSYNGIRHLIWDTGSAFTNKQVIVTGWITVGLTVATALGLTFY